MSHTLRILQIDGDDLVAMSVVDGEAEGEKVAQPWVRFPLTELSAEAQAHCIAAAAAVEAFLAAKHAEREAAERAAERAALEARLAELNGA